MNLLAATQFANFFEGEHTLGLIMLIGICLYFRKHLIDDQPKND
jgi:hypothetical protein